MSAERFYNNYIKKASTQRKYSEGVTKELIFEIMDSYSKKCESWNWIDIEWAKPKEYAVVLICYYPPYPYLKGKGVVQIARYEDETFVDVNGNDFYNIEQHEIKYFQLLPNPK